MASWEENLVEHGYDGNTRQCTSMNEVFKVLILTGWTYIPKAPGKYT